MLSVAISPTVICVKLEMNKANQNIYFIMYLL